MKVIKILSITMILAQAGAALAQSTPPQNWFLLNPSSGFPGLSAETLYSKLAGKKGKTVVVAVLDSGVDFEHEDLQSVMWTNPGEIPGNGKDDDQNGYIDDIHGWNFIGNAKGENVHHDNLEVTRLFAAMRPTYESVDASKLAGRQRKEYALYQQLKEEVEAGRKDLESQFAFYDIIKNAIVDLKKEIGKEEPGISDLKEFKTSDMRMKQIAQILATQLENGQTFKEFEMQFLEEYAYFDGRLNYNYNPDFDSRKIVGDNYSNYEEKTYGNSDVRGPDASHGTHVAGIIAGARQNGIGMDGVADNVRIMSVRVVPDGDERDKDVANAIRYAVDNGAKVLNMSFGKGYSPGKQVVDKAIRYAAKKDVLLVHAAGNDGKENFPDNNFPNDRFEKKGLFQPRHAQNWIEIGALNFKTGESAAAEFSNYSAKMVDVFAPGVSIYSTLPGSTYGIQQGTSMAAPMVSGMAGLLRGYFPTLSARQVKEIIMASVVPVTGNVEVPGGVGEMVPFSALCVSGGMVNIEKAFELASKTPGKSKASAVKSKQGGSSNDQVVP